MSERLTPEGLPVFTTAVSEPALRKPPFAFIAVGLIVVMATLLPLVILGRSRVSTSPSPRVSLVQDMGTQPKYREQQSSEVFADGRADRLRIPGTVARGQLEESDHYYRGFSSAKDADGKAQVTFFDAFPAEAPLTDALVKRGQERFNIYCSVCHGHDGYGNGSVNARAAELAKLPGEKISWVPAASLHADAVRARPVGHIYNTINVGIRSMPGYGAQVPVEDRWAIVAYVRALQLSQNAPASAAATK